MKTLSFMMRGLPFILVAFSSGCGEEKVGRTYPFFDPEQAGPYKVGYKSIAYLDSTRNRELDTAFWYPSLDGLENADVAVNDGRFDSTGSPYPLIMFSHGHVSYNSQSSFLMKRLASHGFIVAAPNHQKNTILDNDETYLGMLNVERPKDIRFVVDQILLSNNDSNHFFYHAVDRDAMGISGHSFGGHTTLIVAGATPNLDLLADYCQSNYWDICPFQEELRAAYPGKIMIDESDPRMKAALALAPDGYYWFLEEGMSKIKNPIMIMGGEKDTVCPLETQQKPIYEGIHSTKYLVIQEAAEHVAYTDFCAALAVDANVCPALQQQIQLLATAFFGLHLKNNKSYGDYLTDSYVSALPGVEMLHELSQ